MLPRHSRSCEAPIIIQPISPANNCPRIDRPDTLKAYWIQINCYELFINFKKFLLGAKTQLT
jgi:hypothetical protein